MSTEIPIWVNGKIRWLSGIDKKTTCKDVVEVLLEGEGIDKSEVKDFTIMERWRKVERPLDENSKILKIWSHWGNEKKEVRLCLRRIDNEVDSGRGSPVFSGNNPSLRRKRNRSRGNGKPPWTISETLHPRRLAELGKFSKREYDEYNLKKIKQPENNENVKALNVFSLGTDNRHNNYEEIYNKIYEIENLDSKKKSGHKSYQCSETGKLHSTLLADNSNTENCVKRTKCCSKREGKQKIRNSENIEKLMKLILVQGATIQSQLQKLKEREEQIESLEHERHRERIEKNGRNYLLETYLGSLKDAEIPVQMNEEKENERAFPIEGSNNQINCAQKKEYLERVNLNETESASDKGVKGCRRGEISHGSRNKEPFNHTSTHYPYFKLQKTTRSKSESRNQECKLEGSLKRTLSDNAINETTGVSSNNTCNIETNVESVVKQNAKDESEEVLELKNIQSQIEMWEKVFKINKKLEKEEENLVRLHIKIKKFQNENYNAAKENVQSNNDTEERTDGITETTLSQQIKYENDCKEVQQNLEALRSDLEQNSKEIYANFTRLIENDEEVEQKRSCLTKLMSDLERTNHEENMLHEMILMSSKQQIDQHQMSFSKNINVMVPDHLVSNNNINELTNCSVIEPSVENNKSIPAINETQNHAEITHIPSNIETSSDKSLSNINNINQITEVINGEETKPQMKPKIVKISFEDQNQNWESSAGRSEKPISVATGALKSILKNRKYSFDESSKKLNSNKESQETLPLYSEVNNDKLVKQNFEMSNGRTQVKNSFSYVPDSITSNYTHPMPLPHYNNYPYELNHSYFGQTQYPKFSEDLKTVYPLKNSYSLGTPTPPTSILPHSTMVTTKAVIHNDTDSSTSSDTSGLSSMYSSSPTVDENYRDQSYVLDTLV